jgi:hypothetical protein
MVSDSLGGKVVVLLSSFARSTSQVRMAHFLVRKLVPTAVSKFFAGLPINFALGEACRPERLLNMTFIL